MHKFIHRMILRSAVNAALQRASVYEAGISAGAKQAFKESAKQWLQEFGSAYRRESANETNWCEAIEALSAYLTHNYAPYLCHGHVRLGITQKMVSLYLKYRWLLGQKDKKPLFAVVDRVIISAAKVANAPNWTALDDRQEYLRIVHVIDEFAKKQGFSDGASWEAEKWDDQGQSA